MQRKFSSAQSRGNPGQISPSQRVNLAIVAVRCRAPLVGYRKVRNSGGVQDERAVIETRVAIGGQLRTIELTLASRTNMRFRMLLGRSGIPDGYYVIPGKSYLLGGFEGSHEFGEEEE